MALTSTKSPMVLVPAMTPRAAITMATPMPAVKITACPALSQASEV